MHGLNDAVRITHMTSINSANKYADSLINAGRVQSSGNGHRKVWYTSTSVSEGPTASKFINEITGSHISHYLISKHFIHFDANFRPNLVTKDDFKMHRVVTVGEN
jgi:hypothetical protein